MYIKILVYIIDNQQFKFKISIPFWLASRLPFLFSALRGLGGRSKKRQPGRADFGEVVRPAYPTYLRISPILTTYPAYPNISGVPTYSYVHIPHPLTT